LDVLANDERGAASGGASSVVALDLQGVTKRFPGVVANDAVDFEAAAGEVHALLGENGAGKTTLMHVASGLYRPDSGAILIDGVEHEFASPRDARAAGVAMVHQHFRLVERFTVTENLILGDTRGEGRRFVLKPQAVERQVRELGERYGLPVDPRAHVWQLSVGEQQRVEILSALYQDARILILDEPTSVLTPQEADTLFTTLRRLAAEGRTVIFISHKLNEVTAVSDRVTVLRDGRNVATVATAEATPSSLASLMVGRAIAGVRRDETTAQESAGQALEVDGISVAGDRGRLAVDSASLAVAPGEIVAIAGVSGNGQLELAEAIAGLRPLVRGTIRVDGHEIRAGDPRASLEARIAYVPQDRHGVAVAPSLSLVSNIALRSYRRDSWGPLLRLRQMRERAVALIRRYEIRSSGPAARAGTLSGGNLQKLVLAREFSGEPRIVVAASPTQGLDVSAIETVHRYLIEAAARGVAVLLISEDLDEILALNDRILVMYEGRLSEVQNRHDPEEIGLLMAGQVAG
jgi:simple sugar transport system ATP-binding protein